MTRGAWIRWCAALVASAALAGTASALTLVEGDGARFEWTQASGPVGGYFVYVSKNGGPMELVTYRTIFAPWTAVYGLPGDEFQVQVQAVSGEVPWSTTSEPSERIRLVLPGNPDRDFPDVAPPITKPAMPMDFDGDGDSDLLFLQPDTGELEAWLVGEDSFETVSAMGRLAAGQQIVGNADYDGDGYADLLIHEPARDALELRTLVGGQLADRFTYPIAPGKRVVGSPIFGAAGWASALLHDPETGVLETAGFGDENRRLRTLPLDASMLGAIDLQDDGIPEIVYERGSELIVQRVSGRGSLPFAAGPRLASYFALAGACSLPGAERDTLVTWSFFFGPQRLQFAEGSHELQAAPIEQLGFFLGRAPVVAAGDFDADGGCDVAIERGPGDVWLVMLDANGAREARQLEGLGSEWVSVGVGAESPPPAP